MASLWVVDLAAGKRNEFEKLSVARKKKFD
jgi:hypothetical protein